jgi:hypothetical protein
MADDGAGAKADIRREVLSYFLRNPDTADSLEGIARWRLLEERVHRTITETQAALEWLVEQGYLVRIDHASAEPVFRLNEEKPADADPEDVGGHRRR